MHQAVTHRVNRLTAQEGCGSERLAPHLIQVVPTDIHMGQFAPWPDSLAVEVDFGLRDQLHECGQCQGKV